MSASEFKNRLPFSGDRLRDLLDRLDGKLPGLDRRSGYDQPTRRRFQRLEYRFDDIPMALEHVGGGGCKLLVNTRNLSDGGLSFLHSGFIYNGSICRFILRRRDGKPSVVRGRVRSCRHVDGIVHEIGVQFDDVLNVEEFVDPAALADLPAEESVQIPEMENLKVLIADANNADASLLVHYLTPTGSDLTNVATPGAALDATKRDRFHIAFMELDMDGEDGVAAIWKLRESNFDGPIIAMTSDPTQERRDSAHQAGATEILSKPFDGRALYQMLNNVLEDVETPDSGACLTSTSADDPATLHLVNKFIDRAKRTAASMQQAIDTRDIELIRSLITETRNSAGDHGFAALGDAADITLRDVSTASCIDDCREQVERLMLLCRSLRSA